MRLIRLLESYYDVTGWIDAEGNLREGTHWMVIRDRQRELTGQEHPEWSYSMGYGWGWIRVFQKYGAAKEMGVEFQTDTVTQEALKRLRDMALRFLDHHAFDRIVYIEFGTVRDRESRAFSDPRQLRRFLEQFKR